MSKIMFITGVILLFGCFTWTEADQSKPCNVPTKPVCKCNFSGTEVEIEPNTSGNEALVGAVSALSSLLLTGGGFGLYMLLKGRCSSQQSPSFGRKSSSLSKESLIRNNRTGPRMYGNAPGSDKPTNVYRSGMTDNISHRSGNRGNSAESYTRGTLSDWS